MQLVGITVGTGTSVGPPLDGQGRNEWIAG